MIREALAPPFFSIVIPAYNAATYIAIAIESVIAQTEANWELIIVDDSSFDSTPAILENYSKRDERIRIYRNDKNLKVARSLNRGIGLAQGKWIVRLDADDFFTPRYLATLRQYAEATKSPHCFFSAWITVVDEMGKKLLDVRLPDAETIQRMMKIENFLYHPATSFSKELWEKVGGYPEQDSTIAEDTAMWTRFIELKAQLIMIPEFLVKYRLHYTNMTSVKDAHLAVVESGVDWKSVRQNREWRTSLYLKQKMLKTARNEILNIFRLQKRLSLKNIQYFLLTFMPASVVYFYMWEVRPRIRSFIKNLSLRGA